MHAIDDQRNLRSSPGTQNRLLYLDPNPDHEHSPGDHLVLPCDRPFSDPPLKVNQHQADSDEGLLHRRQARARRI